MLWRETGRAGTDASQTGTGQAAAGRPDWRVIYSLSGMRHQDVKSGYQVRRGVEMLVLCQTIATWLVVALAVEAVVEILTESDLFAPLHKFLAKLAIPGPDDDPGQWPRWRYAMWWPHKLLGCGYCASVWVAAAAALALPWPIAAWGVEIQYNIVVKIFVVHRLANLWHMSIQLLYRGRVGTYDCTVRIKNGGEPTDAEGVTNVGRFFETEPGAGQTDAAARPGSL